MSDKRLFCSMCGAAATHAAARFCSGCGSPLHPSTESQQTVQAPPAPTPVIIERASESIIHDSNLPKDPTKEVAPQAMGPSQSNPEPLAAKTNFAHDTIIGVDLLPSEKILRITPCKQKSFTQVKDCVLYTTSQRLVCISLASGIVAGTIAKIAKKANYNIESILSLKDIIRADVNGGKIKIVHLVAGNTKTDEYAIGRIPQDLGEFVMKARRGIIEGISDPIVDEFEDSYEVKSTLGKGLSLTGKALYSGTKISIEKYNQLRKIAKESEKIFAEAAKEEDKMGWSFFRGEKGREAERRVAKILEGIGYKTYLNVHLQEREIDIVAERGQTKFMIECKFGKKPIDVGDLDKYVMLYHHARASALKVNGLVFICPTAGITEYAKSNILIQYPNENIRVLGTKNLIEEIEELA